MRPAFIIKTKNLKSFLMSPVKAHEEVHVDKDTKLLIQAADNLTSKIGASEGTKNNIWGGQEGSLPQFEDRNSVFSKFIDIFLVI
jgi:hypothetical protein